MEPKKKKTALAIMAAGLGSRYGGGIKQIAPVGPEGEIIIEYSIRDALEAGFERIVLIIRKDIEDDFREVLGEKLEKLCKAYDAELCLAFQELDMIPMDVPEGRTKPWGTVHAVLCAEEFLDIPFLVINADDYYGKSTYTHMQEFMQEEEEALGLAAFEMGNTLSENGGVSRAIVKQEDGLVTAILERKGIVRDGDEAVVGDEAYALDTPVSMNMWALPASFMGQLEEGFASFLKNMKNETTDEFLLPDFIDQCVKKGTVLVKPVPTQEKWLGVTYSEDLPDVQKAFQELHEQGLYTSQKTAA